MISWKKLRRRKGIKDKMANINDFMEAEKLKEEESKEKTENKNG